MTDFKTGDKVRFTRGGSPWFGQEGVVTAPDNGFGLVAYMVTKPSQNSRLAGRYNTVGAIVHIEPGKLTKLTSISDDKLHTAPDRTTQYTNFAHVVDKEVAEVKVDIINDPQHYGGKDNVYEVIKVIEAWGLGFNLGNLVKYTARAGKKDPATRLQDLKKGRYYIDREIANLEKESK